MEVPIRNKTLLKKLNDLVDEFYELYGEEELQKITKGCSDGINVNDGEWQLSRERLEHYLKIGDQELGFPRDFKAVTMSHIKNSNPQKWTKIISEWRYDFASRIGVKACSLFNYYPPDSWIGWHTNHAANGYQFLFTWSKNGDGYFKYYDKKNDEIVVIPDKPGWQCRWFYFGRLDEPEHMCWHGCYAKGERMTLAYRIDNDKKSSPQDHYAQMIRDDLIDEIMREE